MSSHGVSSIQKYLLLEQDVHTVAVLNIVREEIFNEGYQSSPTHMSILGLLLSFDKEKQVCQSKKVKLPIQVNTHGY